VAQGGAAGLA
nr:Chain I, LACTOFERRIN [Bubalus bubalis]